MKVSVSLYTTTAAPVPSVAVLSVVQPAVVSQTMQETIMSATVVVVAIAVEYSFIQAVII